MLFDAKQKTVCARMVKRSPYSVNENFEYAVTLLVTAPYARPCVTCVTCV